MAIINGTNNGETIDEVANGGSIIASDTINALGGNDTVVLHTNTPGTGATIGDVVHGGTGTDTLRMDLYAPGNFAITADGAGGYNGTYSEVGAGTYNVAFDSIERFYLTLNASGSVTVGDGDDTVSAAAGDSTVTFGLGNDTLIFDRSAIGYTVHFNGGYTGSLAAGYTGYGNADYNGSVSFAGVENFQLYGGGASDMLAAGDGNDILSGGAGNDTLVAGKGTNTVNGGADTDVLSADFSGQASGIVVNLTAAGAQQLSGVGTITGVESFAGSVVGSNFGDTFTEGNYAYNATFDTGTGNDTVTVRNGDDTMNGGAGTDTLIFDRSTIGYALHVTAAPTGTLATGYSGTFQADYNGSASFTGVENFKVYGGGASDQIAGGDGNDVLSGNAGYDTLTAGKGANTIDGGADVDALSIDFSGQTTGITVDLTLAGAQQSGGTGSITHVEAFTGIVTGSNYADSFKEGSYNYNATFNTGAGNDTVAISNGDDTINGGAGTDTLIFDRSAIGYALHVTATPTGDLASGYSGTFQADYNGTATFTGIENFKVYGGAASDQIVTAGGNDTVTGNSGNDQITVGGGTDIVDGGDDTDLLSADYSGQAVGVTVDLTLSGAQQSGGTGSITNVESFFGTVTGSAYADSFKEQAVNANATFNTGDGNDTVTVSNGDDTINGGAGTDTLVFDRSAIGYSLHVTAMPTGDLAGGYSGTFQADYNGSASFSGVENFKVYGGAASDQIVTAGGDDTVIAGDGNDQITVGAGTNIVDGGLATDLLSIDYSGQAQGVKLDLLASGEQQTGGTGSVTNVEAFFGSVVGSAFADTFIDGNVNADATFDTGKGNDTVQVLNGNDTVNMGANNDTLIFDRSMIGYSLHVTTALSGTLATGYSGTFQADYNGSASFTGVENFKVYGGSASDQITSGDGVDVLSGGDGSDTISAAGGNDVVEGGAGTDYLDGGAGIDTASYATAADAVTVRLLLTGAQNTGGAGTDTLTGFENLTGSAFNDNLQGNNGANTLTGGDGDDSLLGGLGDDYLIGGAGADTASYITATGGVTIDLAITVAQNTGSSGMDRLLQIENIRGTAYADVLKGNAAFNLFTAAEGDDQLWGYSGNDTLVGGTGSDTLYGGDGQDALNGGDDGDLIWGEAGLDNLKGEAGNDTLHGGTENDTINGGTGDDVIYGEAGRDILTGDLGADRFVYTTLTESPVGAGTRDQIRDFTTAEGDKIDLSGIDAVTGGGDDAFTFIGSGAFTHVAGQLNAVASGANWIVQGDVDGNGIADFSIQVTSPTALTATDFVL